MQSFTLYYIVFGVIALHFLVGIGFLIYKMNQPPKDKN